MISTFRIAIGRCWAQIRTSLPIGTTFKRRLLPRPKRKSVVTEIERIQTSTSPLHSNLNREVLCKVPSRPTTLRPLTNQISSMQTTLRRLTSQGLRVPTLHFDTLPPRETSYSLPASSIAIFLLPANFSSVLSTVRADLRATQKPNKIDFQATPLSAEVSSGKGSKVRRPMVATSS